MRVLSTGLPLLLSGKKSSNAYSQCKRGKMKYWSFASAQHEADKMTRDKGEEFNSYKCPHCGYYHIGHAISRFMRSTQILEERHETYRYQT